MTEQKKPSASSVIMWSLIGNLIFSLVFGTIISLTSKYSFLEAYIFVFVAMLLILIPTFIWIFVIEPFWWDKMSGKSQETIRNWGIGLLLLTVFILAPSGMVGGSNWSGEGTVNLFPDSADSKNYRLTADIEVNTKWWWQKDYVINSVEWPNGGNSSFSDCVISSSNTSCSDDEGRDWIIEVEEAPESASYSDN